MLEGFSVGAGRASGSVGWGKRKSECGMCGIGSCNGRERAIRGSRLVDRIHTTHHLPRHKLQQAHGSSTDITCHTGGWVMATAAHALACGGAFDPAALVGCSWKHRARD